MSLTRSLLCALLGAALLQALDPGRRVSQYDKRNWRVEDGLPHTYVMSIVPGPDGYMLIGTDEGLARFDGSEFRPEDTDPALRLSKRWILRLVRTRDGSLWVGTFDGWIYRVRDGRAVTAHNAGASVFDILEDRAGTVWASTRSGVLRFSAGRFEAVRGLKRPPDTAWNVLAEDAHGSVWIVTTDGLFRYRSGVVTELAPSGGQYGDVLSVVADRNSHILVGTTQGLFRAGDSRIEKSGNVAAPVVTMLSDRDNNLWIGTWGRGLLRQSVNGSEAWTSKEGLADDFVRTLFEDADGNLWIGTRAGGLSRWKDTPIVTYGVAEGLNGNFASTVVPGREGSLWLGTWRGGLYRFHDGRFEQQPSPMATLYWTVRALALDPSGRPWIGNWEGLSGLTGANYKHYGDADSPYLHVSAIVFDRRHRLWLGTSENGVFLFPGGEPSERFKAYLPGQAVTSLVEDAHGGMWAGTGTGVRHLAAAGEDSDFESTKAGSGDEIASVSKDSDGRIWAATMGGKLCLVSPDRGCLTAASGLPNHPLYLLVDDGKGSFWVSSPKGVLQLPRSEVDAIFEGKRKALEPAWYGPHDGMRTIECHRLSQPCGGRSADGTIWFSTTQGFIRIFPDRIRPARSPAVRFEAITVDGAEAGNNAIIPAGTHALEARFTALDFSSPEKVRFRYKMEGLDPDWVDAGLDRNLRYSGLPAGRFRLLVSARSGTGPWSDPAVASVQQAPRFHQTGWFYLALAVMLAVLVMLLLRWRVHVTRSRYALILQERNRISGEWHDTLLAGFAAISWQLEESLSRMESLPSPLKDPVALALKMLGHYRAEARRVIWDLREDRPETESLSDSVKGSLERLVAGTGIETSVDVSGVETPLSPEQERNVLRICQEAATNAKRHGAPSRIQVHLDFVSDRLSVEIRDNGCGFNTGMQPGLKSGHFGVAVMQERAQRLGGRFRIQSHPGAGTIVETEIPLRRV